MKQEKIECIGESLPSPARRNAVWFTLQLLARILFPIWFRLRVRGTDRIPKAGGALLLINHQSFLDPLVVGTPLSRPVSYVARDSLFRVPVVGWILRHTYVFPINRRAASGRSIREGVRRLKYGFLLGIFPEGTRGDGRSIQRLRPGFVALIRRAKVPVCPVAVVGSHAAMSREIRLPRPRRVYVLFGEPFRVDEIDRLSQHGKEDKLIAAIRSRLGSCLEEAESWRRRVEQPKRPASTAALANSNEPSCTKRR